MFINNETGRPAWLLQQDGDVLYSTVDPADPNSARHHHGATSFAFFSSYREATADEQEYWAPDGPWKADAERRAAYYRDADDLEPSVTVPMQQPQRDNAPTVTPAGLAKPPAAKTRSPAKKKTPAKKKAAAPKAAEKPPAKAAEKPAAEKSAEKPPADQDGEKSPPPPGAGPHGEQGRD